MPAARLYVGNVPYSMDDTRLLQTFTLMGVLAVKANVVMDRETNRSKGFGFVELAEGEDPMRVIQIMDGNRVDGRLLRVAEAISKPGGGGGRRPSGGAPGGGYGGREGGGGQVARSDGEPGRRGRDSWGE